MCVLMYLLHHFPDEHALVVVVLDLLVEGINHQLLGAVAMEALEAEHVGQRNHVHVATLGRQCSKRDERNNVRLPREEEQQDEEQEEKEQVWCGGLFEWRRCRRCARPVKVCCVTNVVYGFV